MHSDQLNATNHRLTRENVRILARHWFTQRTLTEMQCFFKGCGEAETTRRTRHAREQMVRFGAMLDEHVRGEIVEEVEAEQRAKIGDEMWFTYADGDTVERDRQLRHLC
jgi:hypothetical protein